MAKKSKHYFPQEKGKDKLTTINPAAEPDAVHHRHPRPRGRVSSAPTGQKVADSGKVSTGQSDRWPGGGPPEGKSVQVPVSARLKVTISR